MILELALVSAALGAAMAVVRARRARPSAETNELGKVLAAARPVERGLVSGDVLMIPGEELVLGGSLALDEGGFVLRAFSLVGAAQDRWLVQLDPDARDLVLAATSDAIPEGPVPAELPLQGRTLRLEKRGTARVAAQGEGAPAIDGKLAPFVILGERGGRVVVVIDAPGARVALLGERLDPRVVDRLGGGDVPRS